MPRTPSTLRAAASLLLLVAGCETRLISTDSGAAAVASVGHEPGASDGGLAVDVAHTADARVPGDARALEDAAAADTTDADAGRSPDAQAASDVGSAPDAARDAGVSDRVLHVLWTVHVEGDAPSASASDPACGQPGYQQAGFEADLAGLEALQREAVLHQDSLGRTPRMHISPAAEFFETELDATYGGQAFRTYDWLALGHEVGIQGHAVASSGTPYCWPQREASAQGCARKLEDLHGVAEQWFDRGRKVNLGLTFTPGVKLDVAIFNRDRAATESYLDHVGYRLGYRVAFEDWDGCIEDSPESGLAAPRYLYRADYGDGVQMYKVCFQGAPSTTCSDAQRCETPDQAVQRLDATLAALRDDPDDTHLYYFAFATHANLFDPAAPQQGETAGTLAVLSRLDALRASGQRIVYVTPRELAATDIHQRDHLGPVYFMAVHNEPQLEELSRTVTLPALQSLVARADSRGMKLTLMFASTWGPFMTSDAQRQAELVLWRQRGHEIAAHHHGLGHPGVWDGYSDLDEDAALAERQRIKAHPEAYLGTLDDLMEQLRRLDPYIRAGCMNEESGAHLDLPDAIVYSTCSGYANTGVPGTTLRDSDVNKARSTYVSVGEVAGIERRWLAHAHVFNSEQVAAAAQLYASSDGSEVHGYVTHSTPEQGAAMEELMDLLAARDPLGERCMTLSDIVRFGLLPEQPLPQQSADGGVQAVDAGALEPDAAIRPDAAISPDDAGVPGPDGGLPSCQVSGLCPTSLVCCALPAPCAGQCVPDCRADGQVCPVQLPRCSASTGLCEPVADAGVLVDSSGPCVPACTPGQSVCCPPGLPCAGRCVLDCRAAGAACPSQVPTCDEQTGMCVP